MTGQRDALAALDAPRRMRRFLLWSMAVHAAILLAVLAVPKPDAEAIHLTEIVFLEPGEAEAAPVASSAGGEAAPRPSPAPAAQAEQDVRFERELTRAEMSPQPQSAAVVGDQMSARLNQLQEIAATRLSSSEPSSMSSAAWGPAGAGASAAVASAGGVSLNRGATAGSGAPSLALTRGTGTRGLSPAAVATGLPGGGAPSGPKPAQETEAHARKQLEGATLMGPIADRPIRHMIKPVYPDWAKREAIEASVTLYFLVAPDGNLREGVVVQKTSGFQDFDENARRAIQAWRFQALGPGQSGDQWGTVTFHFRLTNGG